MADIADRLMALLDGPRTVVVLRVLIALALVAIYVPMFVRWVT